MSGKVFPSSRGGGITPAEYQRLMALKERAGGGGMGELPPYVDRETMRRIVVWNSPHERCGIGEYGKALTKSLAKIIDTFTPSSSTLEAAGAGDTWLVHYERAIEAPGLREACAAARRRGARVVFCCHVYGEFMQDKFRGVVDRFVVHRDYPGQMRAENMSVLPLGCQVYTPHVARASSFTLITSGFIASWKRLPELLHVLVPLLPAEVSLRVLAPHPFHAQEADEEAALRRVIGRHSVETTFLPTEQLLEELSKAHLGFVYHPRDTESVSAAVKQFISARTPVVVSGSSHASDMVGGVYRVGTLDPTEFAHEIAALLGGLRGRSMDALRESVETEYQRINMDEVARLYVEMMRGMP